MGSSTQTKQGGEGKVSWGGLLHLTTVLARIPFVVAWVSVRNAIFHRDSFRRKTVAALIRWTNDRTDVAQMQWVIPSSSVDVYKTWAAANAMPVTVEALADDSYVMWLGPKRTDKVVLYFHGGAYYAPILSPGFAFLDYVQKELAKEGCDVGFAVIGYSLVPHSRFPTQIRQAMLATEHILASGVHPRDLHLMADSAGGNLMLGLLSHILHPLEAVRPMIWPTAKAPFASAYLMSPWVCMRSSAASMVENAEEDMVSSTSIKAVGALFMDAVPAAQRAYAEPMHAPDGWFAGLDAVVGRMLVTAGGKEVFRDDIVQFSESLSKVKSQYKFILQPEGCHDDPLLDFMAGLPHDQLGSLAGEIVQWLGESIQSSDGS